MLRPGVVFRLLYESFEVSSRELTCERDARAEDGEQVVGFLSTELYPDFHQYVKKRAQLLRQMRGCAQRIDGKDVTEQSQQEIARQFVETAHSLCLAEVRFELAIRAKCHQIGGKEFGLRKNLQIVIRKPAGLLSKPGPTKLGE